MKILKYIQILSLILVPQFLLSVEQQPSSAWLQEARSGQQYGAWTTQDKTGKTILVQGEVISSNGRIIASEQDLEKIVSLFADVMAGTFENISEVSKLGWLYAKANSWWTGKTHRDRIYDVYIENIKSVMHESDKDIYYIVTVSELQADGSVSLLGAAIFDIKQDFEYGTVELDVVSVKQEAQSRGLLTILGATIFKLLPNTECIILDVLQNNFTAIQAYEHLGFTRYNGKYKFEAIINLIDPEYHYEYLTEKPSCQRFQECAAKFVERI